MKQPQYDPEALDSTLTIRIPMYYKQRFAALAGKRHVSVGDILREYVRSQVDGTPNRLAGDYFKNNAG